MSQPLWGLWCELGMALPSQPPGSRGHGGGRLQPWVSLCGLLSGESHGHKAGGLTPFSAVLLSPCADVLQPWAVASAGLPRPRPPLIQLLWRP